MAKDINLLPGEITQERKRKERKKSFNLIAYVFLGACIFISSIFFIYHFFQNRTLQSLISASRGEEQKIKDLRAIEEEAVRLEVKNTALSGILKLQKKYSFLLEMISKSAPTGLKINSLVSSLADDVQVSGVADSYAILSRFLINTIDPEMGGVIFTAADLNSVNLDERVGGARFLMTLYIKKGSLETSALGVNKE